ncbi:MAG: hypothetical protein AAGD96_04390 [Chloroflexota bacterium]
MNYHQLGTSLHKEYEAAYTAQPAQDTRKVISPKAISIASAFGATLLAIISILI